MNRKLASLLGACLITLAPAAHATLLDFEDVALAPGGQTADSSVTTRGFLFSSSLNHLHRNNEVANLAASGSTTLLVHVPDNVVTIAPTAAGSTFSIQSAQLAELFVGAPASNVTSISVTGSLQGGGTISTSFTLDGVLDGPGGVADFQTFSFSSGWTNLLSVSFVGVGSGDGWAVDNILVNEAQNPVPAPGALALLGLGLAGLAGIRRRG